MRRGSEVEELPPMDLRAFPPHEAGETLEAYLRRSIGHEDVSVSALEAP